MTQLSRGAPKFPLQVPLVWLGRLFTKNFVKNECKGKKTKVGEGVERPPPSMFGVKTANLVASQKINFFVRTINLLNNHRFIRFFLLFLNTILLPLSTYLSILISICLSMHFSFYLSTYLEFVYGAPREFIPLGQHQTNAYA